MNVPPCHEIGWSHSRMLTPTKLLQLYRRAIAEPIKSGIDESVSVLYSTDWVKIMVVRDQESPEICFIEVEISLPPCTIDPSTNTAAHQNGTAREFIEDTISHLKYLLRLESAGLVIGILSAEGIWSASLRAQENPDERLFEALIPPS